jgi:hypothetical protein
MRTPSVPSALLHLVSEQTMQNLLPLLALRPKTVVQVRSRDDRFRLMAEHLENAVAAIRKTSQYRDLTPEFFDVVIDEVSPSTDRTRSQVGESLSLWPGAVVNLTGGTKPMCIGAYLAADYQREPVLYCDTQERRFVSLNERCPLPKLPSFDEIAAGLNVETVMAAHGRGPQSWKSRTPEDSLTQFGSRTAAIRAQADAKEFEEFMRSLRKHFRPEGKYLPRVLPLMADSALKADYFSAAAQAGLLTSVEEGVTALAQDRQQKGTGAPPAYLPVRQSTRDNEKLHKLLDGLWLELHVLDLIHKHSHFHDAHWSIEPAGAEGDFGETDILCVDRQKAGLLLVSCKSIAPGLEHFEALRRRTELFGGSHTRTVLCIFYPPSNEIECRRWAKSLNVTTIIGAAEIAAFFGSPAMGVRLRKSE